MGKEIMDKVLVTLDEHTEILNEHTKILNEHSARMDGYDEDIRSIKRTLVIIEDAVTNKIPLLFEAYAAHQQHQENTDKEVDNLIYITEEHSIKITSLENTLAEHSEQLTKLSLN